MIHVQKATDTALSEAARRLADGEIIIYARDSNYIMCTSISSESSVKHMFDLISGTRRCSGRVCSLRLLPSSSHTSLTSLKLPINCSLVPEILRLCVSSLCSHTSSHDCKGQFSLANYLEITHQGVNKAMALLILGQHLAITPAEMVAIGDGGE